MLAAALICEINVVVVGSAVLFRCVHRIKNVNNDDGKRICLAMRLLFLLLLLLLALKFYDIFSLSLFCAGRTYITRSVFV